MQTILGLCLSDDTPADIRDECLSVVCAHPMLLPRGFIDTITKQITTMHLAGGGALPHWLAPVLQSLAAYPDFLLALPGMKRRYNCAFSFFIYSCFFFYCVPHPPPPRAYIEY